MSLPGNIQDLKPVIQELGDYILDGHERVGAAPDIVPGERAHIKLFDRR